MYKIYLILADTNGINQWKIGITSNITKRLQILRVGNPNIVGVSATYEIKDRQIAYSVENIVKKYFKQYKVQGEWFKYECLNVDIFIDSCKRAQVNANISKIIQDNIKNDKNNNYII